MFKVTYFYVREIIFDTNDELTWRIMDWIIFLVSRALVSVSSIDRVWRFIRWWSRVTSRDTSCDTDLTSRVLQVQFSKNDTDFSSNQKYNNKHLRWSDPIDARNQAKRACRNILQRNSRDIRLACFIQENREKFEELEWVAWLANKTVGTVTDSDGSFLVSGDIACNYFHFYCDFSLLKTNQTEERQAVRAASKVLFY